MATKQSNRSRSRCFALLSFSVLFSLVPAVQAETREFYIATVHYDGKTNVQGDATHKPEAFPKSPLKSSNGMFVKGPDNKGNWRVRSFAFSPAEVTVRRGDDVVLHFVGVHGGMHNVQVDGVSEVAAVTRGTQHTVRFRANEAGIISFTCVDHPPSMRGQVVVLP